MPKSKFGLQPHTAALRRSPYAFVIIVLLATILLVNVLLVLQRIHVNADAAAAAAKLRANDLYYTSDDTARTGALTARIKNVTENSDVDYAFTFGPSQTMLIMSLSITNDTAATQHLLPSNQLFIHSGEGEYAAMHASVYAKKPLSAVDLKPGQTASGQVSFAVPKHAADLRLFIDTGWNGYAPAVFRVLQ